MSKVIISFPLDLITTLLYLLTYYYIAKSDRELSPPCALYTQTRLAFELLYLNITHLPSHRLKAKTSTQAFDYPSPLPTSRAYMRTPSVSRSQSNLKKIASTRPKLTSREKQQQQTISAGLAICLLGSYKIDNMSDSEYEEEVRKQAVMQVSLLSCRSLAWSPFPLSSLSSSIDTCLIGLAWFPEHRFRSMLINRKSSPTRSCGRNGKLPKPH